MSLQRSGEQHPAVQQQRWNHEQRGHDYRPSKRRSIAWARSSRVMTFDGADSCFSRSAAAVALVPAEQQGDETLRGGRTQFDVDGTVTGHRL